MTQAVFGGAPTKPCTTDALSKWRKMLSAALRLRPSPSQINDRSSLAWPLPKDFCSTWLLACRKRRSWRAIFSHGASSPESLPVSAGSVRPSAWRRSASPWIASVLAFGSTKTTQNWSSMTSTAICPRHTGPLMKFMMKNCASSSRKR